MACSAGNCPFPKAAQGARAGVQERNLGEVLVVAKRMRASRCSRRQPRWPWSRARRSTVCHRAILPMFLQRCRVSTPRKAAGIRGVGEYSRHAGFWPGQRDDRRHTPELPAKRTWLQRLGVSRSGNAGRCGYLQRTNLHSGRRRDDCGVVNFRTLEADDLIKDGSTRGARLNLRVATTAITLPAVRLWASSPVRTLIW